MHSIDHLNVILSSNLVIEIPRKAIQRFEIFEQGTGSRLIHAEDGSTSFLDCNIILDGWLSVDRAALDNMTNLGYTNYELLRRSDIKCVEIRCADDTLHGRYYPIWHPSQMGADYNVCQTTIDAKTPGGSLVNICFSKRNAELKMTVTSRDWQL